MRLETIRQNVILTRMERAHLDKTMHSALVRYIDDISLVRIWLLKVGAHIRCRMRAWQRSGPIIVVSKEGEKINDAVDATADALRRALHRSRGNTISSSRRSRKRLLSPDKNGIATKTRAIEAGNLVHSNQDDRQKMHTQGRLPVMDSKDAPVILMMSETLRPRVALLRASMFANRMGAPLIIAVCLPKERYVNRIFPQKTVVESAAAVSREYAAVRRVWRWCRRNVMLPLSLDSVLPMRGELPSCAAYVAHKIRAQLVVISESDIKNGHEAMSIVEQAGVPIMISRIKRARNTVIVATDMTEQDFPVVHEGAAVAGALGAPLTIVHNVQPQIPMPVPVAPAIDGSMYAPVTSEKELERMRKQKTMRLEKLANEVGKARVEVLQTHDTVGSILDLAKNQQADMMVVGHHKRRWPGNVFGGTFASLAVERSTRSIVVVPMG